MSTNPLIQDLIQNEAFPSVTIAFPTGGRWYDKGIISDEADPMDIEVGVLGMLAEQNYRDPWLMLSGESIPRMLKSICPSVISASDLCEIDLDAILLAARLVSYGSRLELHHICREPKKEEKTEDKPKKKIKQSMKEAVEVVQTLCAFENVVVVDINEHILRYDVITDAIIAEKFVHKLSRVNQTVHLRPMTYGRVISQIKAGMTREKELNKMVDVQIDALVTDPDSIKQYVKIIDLASDNAIDNIAAAIHCIETTTGKMVNGNEFIREWILTLPTDEADALVKKINSMVEWFQSFSDITYDCAECGSKQTFRLELNADQLFGQAEDSQPPKKPSRKSKKGGRRRKIQ